MKIWFANPQHWHGKGFALHWELPDAKMVFVHYENGEKKPWHLRTSRSYRFKRWFFRKSSDSFKNIANYYSGQITLYVLQSYFSLPEKVVIPMAVSMLRVEEPALAVSNTKMNIAARPFSPDYGSLTVLIAPIKQDIDIKQMPRIPAIGQIQPLLEDSLRIYYLNNSTNTHE
jgi:hypothetical protein